MLSPSFLAPAGLPLPAAAFAQDPPQDPSCPLGDMASARPAGSECIGRLTRGHAFALAYDSEIRTVPALGAMVREEARSAERWIAGIARDWVREREQAGA